MHTVYTCHFFSLTRYEWFVPIKWMKTGVAQDQYWLMKKSGTEPEKRICAACLLSPELQSSVPSTFVNEHTGSWGGGETFAEISCRSTVPH